MKAHAPTAALAVIVAVCTATAAGPGDAQAKRGVPRVEQMVLKRDSRTTLRTVPAKRTTVTVKGDRCVIPAATPMASLLRTSWRRHIRFHDYGSCSLRPADSAGLFVRAIKGDVNRGLDGWVYKVGRKLGTAGAADPAGPFGSGRLRRGQQVVWFYCRFSEGSCQRSLEVEATVEGRTAKVAVTGYDDAGDGVPVGGARVVARGAGGTVVRTTGADGRAELPLSAAGRYALRASKARAIPSFPERIDVD